MVIRELWHISSEETQIISKNCVDDDRSKILVKSLYSLISSGTERLVCKGQVPAQIENLMRVPNMEGSFAFPLKYGYSLVGQVVEGDKEWIGKQVHLMHPHQDFALVSPEQVSVIPEGLPVARAVLASTMETAMNAVWDSAVSIGDKVLINGFGIIGALTACVISKMPGVQLFINEINTERKKIAESMGFKLFQETEENFDFAFNATATGQGLQFCIDKTGFEGTIIEMSWFGTKSIELKLGLDFHIKRQRIISSQVSQIPGNKQNRWSFNRRKALVFELLKDPIFDSLLTKQVPFSDAPMAFDSIRQGNMNDICIIFNYL